MMFVFGLAALIGVSIAALGISVIVDGPNRYAGSEAVLLIALGSLLAVVSIGLEAILTEIRKAKTSAPAAPIEMR